MPKSAISELNANSPMRVNALKVAKCVITRVEQFTAYHRHLHVIITAASFLVPLTNNRPFLVLPTSMHPIQPAMHPSANPPTSYYPATLHGQHRRAGNPAIPPPPAATTIVFAIPMSHPPRTTFIWVYALIHPSAQTASTTARTVPSKPLRLPFPFQQTAALTTPISIAFIATSRFPPASGDGKATTVYMFPYVHCSSLPINTTVS
ncbi:hypothetical protein C8R43DRAFT_1122940 [Mycena crocata]|nr:hypothetical protein C8R43DRAFT_1122940 [Mycena crocata]